MVVKPQKTKFQLKIVENIQTLSIWAINPWRRYSISPFQKYSLLKCYYHNFDHVANEKRTSY